MPLSHTGTGQSLMPTAVTQLRLCHQLPPAHRVQSFQGSRSGPDTGSTSPAAPGTAPLHHSNTAWVSGREQGSRGPQQSWQGLNRFLSETALDR